MTASALRSDTVNLVLPWPPERALRGEHVAYFTQPAILCSMRCVTSPVLL